MATEIVSMPFERVERSYFSKPGWRLATFEEAKNGLEMIKEHNILERWDRVRLLDGWLLGPGYDFQMGNDFKGCLGYMLLIQNPTSGHAYADVELSDSQKEVALLLCGDDWNYEVVYWLFNSWSKTDGMYLQDVIDGGIPFSNPVKFKKMNSKVCSLARKLGNKGPVTQKANKRKYLGRESARDVLSDMIEIVNEENLPQYSLAGYLEIDDMDDIVESCLPRSLEPEWLEDLAREGGADWNIIVDAIWNFLSESFAEFMVLLFSNIILSHICKRNDEDDLKTVTSSKRNFMFATSILFNLSNYIEDIIHTPLAHGCKGSCTAKMIQHLASNCGRDDLPHFNKTLQNNAMWRCTNQEGNYDLLNKLVIAAAGGHASSRRQTKAETVFLLVNRLLDCGAQVGSTYLISGAFTSLEHAIGCIEYDDIVKVAAEFLLSKCADEEEEQQLVNTPNKYQSERTPLHFASKNGYANTCLLLLQRGARLNVKNTDDRTPLHIAVKEDKDAVVNVFIENPQVTGVVDLKDKLGESPLDRAVRRTDMKLLAKLVTKSAHPEAYYNQVDLKQLLRYSLLEGCEHIVEVMFEKGIKLSADDCDEEGKTTLHLAAMCENDEKAMKMVDLVFEKSEGMENLVIKCDRRGRTALQEAALNGNKSLCDHLLKINPRIIDLKDKDGRNPIYDAAEAKKNAVDIIQMLVDVYSKKDILLNDLIDRNGTTPLHVAASVGKKYVVKFLLSTANSLLPNAKSRRPFNRRDLAQEGLEYRKKADFLGQTALHKAAKCGDYGTVEILLNEGAHPLEERDCDGRTALHYAVKTKTEGGKEQLIELLLQKCKTDEEKLLLLWASAAGLGTADKSLNNDDPVHEFIGKKMDHFRGNLSTGNLLKIATSMGNIEMTKELIARGYQIKDIRDPEWRRQLGSERNANVKKVSKQLERIAEQVNDQPTVEDNLGRIDYAKGLAAFLLNPYIKPPIVVGISGTWGMGKSSLMVQTESILLKTAAQMALLPYSKFSSSTSELPEITSSELSKLGKRKYEEIKRYVDIEQNGNKPLFSTIMDKFWSWLKKNKMKKSGEENGYTEQDSLAEFLNNYEAKYRKIFKSLAAMDNNNMFTTRSREDQESQNIHSKSMWKMVMDMFKTNHQRSKSRPQQSIADSLVEENVPAILTVQYNAWKYMNETEALAGLAVEITRELEGIMTEAQWLSTCWRNTWKKKKYNIWIEIIYPCLLAVVLASTITWILWVILDRSEKFKNWTIPKYACLPTGIVCIGWIVTRSILGILKPVSTQLMSYISFPDHTDKLGYQERVISDITFLKDEIGKKPCMVFKAYSWAFTMISTLWLLLFEWWITPLLFHHRIFGKNMSLPNITAASGKNLRIIVFIDDLDRCHESVILQVLSAINLVLAVCEINVVLGIDKELIERAIIRKYGDMETERSFKDNQELADKYLQKIIQLPLDLPDPSEEQSRMFLKGQLGVFQEQSEDIDSTSKMDITTAKMSRQKTLAPEATSSRSTLWDELENETSSEIHSDAQVGETHVEIDMQHTNTTRRDNCTWFQFFKRQFQNVFCGKKDTIGKIASDGASSLFSEKEREVQKGVPISKNPTNKTSNKNYLSWIPIMEMLFVRYSKGEQDAFCYFQKLATGSRKLPREWKRHLTYHRLVWYIFYLTREAKDLTGWQNWNQIGNLKSSSANGPSLQMIVDHFMEFDSKENLKITGTSPEEEETKETTVKDNTATDKNIETESSVREQKKSEEIDKDHMLREDRTETSIGGNADDRESKKVDLEKLDSSVDKHLNTSERRLRTELYELRKEMALKLDELKKEIKELKDESMKQQRQRDRRSEKEKRTRLKHWGKLKLALHKYDVSLDAILSFQRFRFYCIAGHLSWPLSEQV